MLFSRMTSWSEVFRSREPLITGTPPVFHINSALLDEQIVAKGRDGSIQLELLPAIVGSGRWRENLDEHGGIRDRFERFGAQDDRPADHDRVGVRIESGGREDSSV